MIEVVPVGSLVLAAISILWYLTLLTYHVLRFRQQAPVAFGIS